MSATVTPIGRSLESAAHTGTQHSPRLQALLDSHRAVGYLDGERAGYKAGWRYGVICGVLPGALLVAAGLWLGLLWGTP